MRVYPALLALLASKAERESWGYEVPDATPLSRPTCQRCLYSLDPTDYRACPTCGAPWHFAFCGIYDRNGKTVADFPDMRLSPRRSRE